MIITMYSRNCMVYPLISKFQVLIATATVAWGVNFPAHLVVIKGTEYFDGKQKRYVDMPITDVLQGWMTRRFPTILCLVLQDSVDKCR